MYIQISFSFSYTKTCIFRLNNKTTSVSKTNYLELIWLLKLSYIKKKYVCPISYVRLCGWRRNKTVGDFLINLCKAKIPIRLAIKKIYLYNFDPLKPHFYLVKLRFTGVYISFLISAQNIDCGYSLEPPRRGGSNEYHNLWFEQKYERYRNFLSENIQFLVVKFSVYLNRRVFVMY